MQNISYSNLGAIFMVTFLLVFFILVMVEPNITCANSGSSGGCHLVDSGGFFLGVLASAMLFMGDMALVYKMLSDFLL